MGKTILTAVLGALVIAGITGAFKVNSSLTRLTGSDEALQKNLAGIEARLGGLPQDASRLSEAVRAQQSNLERQQALLDREDAQIQQLALQVKGIETLTKDIAQLREEVRAGFAGLDKRVQEISKVSSGAGRKEGGGEVR